MEENEDYELLYDHLLYLIEQKGLQFALKGKRREDYRRYLKKSKAWKEQVKNYSPTEEELVFVKRLQNK